MVKSFKLWQLIGFVLIVMSGVLLHFLYEWSGDFILFAPFSAVNESTWEHMKLLFIPALIFAIVESFFFKNKNDFWDIKLKGILLGLVLIPIMFYTFNGAIGKSPDWINIAIFVSSVAIMILFEIKQFKKNNKNYISKSNSAVLLCFILLLFVIFTFYPLNLEIFKDSTEIR